MAASPNWIRIKRGRRQDTFDYCIFEVPPLKKAVFKLEKTCRRPEPFGRIGEVDDDLRKRFEKSPPIAPGEHIWIGEPMKIDDDNCAVLNFDRVDDEKFSSADEYFYDHYQLVIVAKDITVALAAGLPLVKLVEDVKEAQDSNEFDNLSDMDIDSEKSFGLQDVEHHKCPDMTKEDMAYAINHLEDEEYMDHTVEENDYQMQVEFEDEEYGPELVSDTEDSKDSEDSNAEDNPRNDYPDESSSDESPSEESPY
ncbi:OLC1v1006388C1 [Oldenlandia corymbosa var. corymbosa]|uniref:OLC1v1006388C1 n=1 Tax=Oldenlandia corymbosa var. corymbosa TaxID=529605 RepID=A0AAV1DIA7_OLDCO|nr:OLC1v1006388C1 [Oldenlandia corymbosa var. corymbosa]